MTSLDMSFQSAFRLVGSRALLIRGGSRGLVSSRHCNAPAAWRSSRNHWLSTSKEETSWGNSNVSAEPLETLHDEDTETDRAAEKDRMLGEIRKSIHENVERILDEKPEVKKKWKRIIHRWQKERQVSSYSAMGMGDPWNAQTTMALQSSKNHASNTDLWSYPTRAWSEEMADRGRSDSRKENFDSARNASPLGDAGKSEQIQSLTTTHNTCENQSLPDLLQQSVEDEIRSENTALKTKNEPIQEDFGSVWGGTEKEHVQSAIKTNETSANQSFLDLLRQPVEEKTTGALELDVGPEDGESSSQPASLLTLLNDEEADFLEDEMHGSGTRSLKSSLSDDSHKFTRPSTASEHIETSSPQPTSLLDLLDDDGVESNADSKTDEEVNQSPSLLEMLQDPIEDGHASSLGLDNERDISGGNYLWSIEKTPMNHKMSVLEDRECLSPSEAIDQGLALLLALEGHDWLQLEDDDEKEELDSSWEDDVDEIALETDYEENEIMTEADSETEEVSDEEENEREGDDSIFDTVRDLLEDASFGEISLSSADYNSLLLQLASSPLKADDAIAMMLKIYQQMSELGQSGTLCAPDAATFTILMVTLDRRGNAPLSAADICRQMMDSDVELSSEALIQGIRCLDRRNDVNGTERLMNLVLDSETTQLKVPLTAWMALLRMYKSENLQQEALVLIQKCIKVSPRAQYYQIKPFLVCCSTFLQKNGERDVRTVAKIVMETISWPRRDRSGRRIDRSSFLSRMLDTLESFSIEESASHIEDSTIRVANTDIADEHSNPYKPSYKVWKRLILSLAAEVDKETNSGWPLVHRAFKSMRNALDDYWPDSSLLKTGLNVAEITGDAELAVDLVLRAQDRHSHETKEFGSTSLWSDDGVGIGDESDSVLLLNSEALHMPEGLFGPKEANKSEETTVLSDAVDVEGDVYVSSSTAARRSMTVRVPPQAFGSAMRVSIATNDTDSTERLLDGIRDSRNTIPNSMKSELFTLALKGYAKVGNSDAAQSLLKEMQHGELNPSEKAYGTVIYSLAVAKKTKEACELFDLIESGRFNGVAPGLTCYNGRMLAHIEAHEWDKALECHYQRKEAGLPCSSATFQDVLLASYRLGKKAKALETIEEALESGMKMDYACCDLSMKILLGDVFKSKRIDQARKKLREIGEQNQELKRTSLNLSRALRSAEVEEKRLPTNGLKLNDISSRREQAWRDALKHLVKFIRAIETAENSEATSA